LSALSICLLFALLRAGLEAVQ